MNDLQLIPLSNYTPGVYFLIDNGNVVYVGQSVNPPARIADHMNCKVFNCVYLLPCDKADLDDLEGALIRTMNPGYNCTFPLGSGREDRKILSEYGLPSKPDEILEVLF